MARRPRWTSRLTRSKDRFSSFTVRNRHQHLISRQAHPTFHHRIIIIFTQTQLVTPTSTPTCNQTQPHSSSTSTICHTWSQRPTATANQVKMEPQFHKRTRRRLTTICLWSSLRPPPHSPTQSQTLTRMKIMSNTKECSRLSWPRPLIFKSERASLLRSRRVKYFLHSHTQIVRKKICPTTLIITSPRSA